MESIWVSEILANLMGGKNSVKADEAIGRKLANSLESLEPSLYESETQAFFVTKEKKAERRINHLEMNVELFKMLQKYNAQTSEKRVNWP